MEIFHKLYELLDARERRNAILLFGMMVVMGLLEAVGVASVMPFMTVLANPEIVHSNDYLGVFYTRLGFEDTHSFLIFLGACTFTLVLSSLAFKGLTQWAVARYVQMRNYTLGSRLLRGYLQRPYSFFLNRHSSDLGKKVLSEVAQVISYCLKPAVELVSNAVVMIFIVALLVVINPLVAVTAVVTLSGTYALIYLVLRRYLGVIGATRVEANQQRFQVAQEALEGIKDIKVLGLENGYIQGFRRPANSFARSKANAQIISEIPKFVLQAMVFGGMLLVVLTLLAVDGNDLSTVLPLVTVYGLAASRLIPALQNVYKAVTQLRFGGPALDLLYADFMETGEVARSLVPGSQTNDRELREPIRLVKNLKLENVCYTYPYAPRKALKSITLTIEAKTTVGFVGSTGAGKTTVVDIILGLLEPQKGVMKIDDFVLSTEDLTAWQRNIGYVPQHIFLSDDSVAANIAFGVDKGAIDYDAVVRAAKIADLDRFVREEMPEGYDTMIGDRGVRLSGGQRQRIGIARALYRDPDVLVLDEATSALDTITESAVMEAVQNIGDRKTIIIIAHRLSTVRQCHTIFLLERGTLAGKGSYDELVNENPQFEAMAAQ